MAEAVRRGDRGVKLELGRFTSQYSCDKGRCLDCLERLERSYKTTVERILLHDDPRLTTTAEVLWAQRWTLVHQQQRQRRFKDVVDITHVCLCRTTPEKQRYRRINFLSSGPAEHSYFTGPRPAAGLSESATNIWTLQLGVAVIAARSLGRRHPVMSSARRSRQSSDTEAARFCRLAKKLSYLFAVNNCEQLAQNSRHFCARRHVEKCGILRIPFMHIRQHTFCANYSCYF